MQRIFAEGGAALLLLLLIRRWGETRDAFEQADERSDAIEAYTLASFGNGDVGLQELFCVLDTDAGQVLVWRLAVGGFEQPDKMKFREGGFIGHVVDVDGLEVVVVDEKLGLYEATVQIYFWIGVQGGRFPYHILKLFNHGDLKK